MRHAVESHFTLGGGGGCAVFGKRCYLVVGIAERFEHLFGVASERRAWTVNRLVVRHCEGASDSDKFTYFTALVYFYKGVAVVEGLVAHNLFCRENRTYRNTGGAENFGDFKFGFVGTPSSYAGVYLLFVAVASVCGVEVRVVQPVFKSEGFAC